MLIKIPKLGVRWGGKPENKVIVETDCPHKYIVPLQCQACESKDLEGMYCPKCHAYWSYSTVMAAVRGVPFTSIMDRDNLVGYEYCSGWAKFRQLLTRLVKPFTVKG